MKKTGIYILILFILLLISATIFWNTSPYRISFYRVDDNQIDFISSSIKEQKNVLGIRKKIKINKLTPETPLEKHLETLVKPDLLFTGSQASLESVSETLNHLDKKTEALIPPTSRKIFSTDETRLAYPIQLDHIELTYHIRLFSRYGINPANTLKELNLLLNIFDKMKSDGYIPLLVAGGENRALLDFISLMILSYNGPENYRQIVHAVSSNKNFKTAINYLPQNGFSISNILDTITEWENNGYLHPEWTQFQQEDLVTSLESGYSGVALMRLSEHRKIPYQLINQYSSLIFPFAETKWNTSGIIAPSMAVASPEKIFGNDKNKAIISALLETAFQKALNERSGLGPVNSSSQTLDLQSTQVRFWAAASRSIQSDIASAAFTTELERDAFAAQIRNYLEAGMLAK